MPSFLIVALAAYVVSRPVLGALPVPELVAGKSVRLSDVLAHVRLQEPERGRLVDVWVATTLVLAFLALASYVAVVALGMAPNDLARGGSRALGASIVRAAGLMHPTALAIYLTLGLALVVHRRRWQPFALGLILVTSVLTFSRAIAGVAITLAVLGYRGHDRGWLARRRHVLAAAAMVLVLAVAITTLWPLTPLARQDRAVLGIGVNSTANAYPLHHLGAVRMFVEHPLFGIGAGEFGAHVCAYTSDAERGRSSPPLRCDVEWDPHSMWLGAALVALAFDGLHVDYAHAKFVWAFLGLALAAAATDATSDRAG